MLRISIICLMLLTGCAGSAYRLPDITDAEVQAMKQKVESNKASLETYERSDKKYKQILKTISNRLVKSAEPLCTHANYQSCYFEVSYNPDNIVNAYASESNRVACQPAI